MPCSSSTISVFDAARCRVTGATRCGDIGGIDPVDPSLRSISRAVTLDACAASIGGSCFETSFAFVVAPAPSRAFMISSTCHISTHRFCATCFLSSSYAVERSPVAAPSSSDRSAIHGWLSACE